MTRAFLVESDRYDVYYNQAVEKNLLDEVKDDEIILYLWQNEKTIVIGKNQDAYSECHIETLNEDGGYLARRISGGGAVYHDKGNLNFTFICKKDLFDIQRQDQIIIDALKALGIDAEKNGRNDLLINGRKFSGHAYYQGKESCLHHGTLMIEVDEDALSRYLNVSMIKLRSKNVRSVRSRIINLKSIKNDLSIEILKKALTESFAKAYHSDPEGYMINSDEVEKRQEFFSSKEWIYGPRYDHYLMKEVRSDQGTFRIFYLLDKDVIEDIRIYTDAMDVDLPENIEKRLKGKRIKELNSEEETKAVIRVLKEEKR